MTAQLAEISQAVAPGAHAVLLLDQAGWHVSPKLPVPANITLLPLPPRSPELNPVENIWQFVRDNWAVEPDFRLLRRNPRSRLRRVEQARRPALDHYVHRTARLGSRVLISARRYQAWPAEVRRQVQGGRRRNSKIRSCRILGEQRQAGGEPARVRECQAEWSTGS
jgi:hypothetical protein